MNFVIFSIWITLNRDTNNIWFIWKFVSLVHFWCLVSHIVYVVFNWFHHRFIFFGKCERRVEVFKDGSIQNFNYSKAISMLMNNWWAPCWPDLYHIWNPWRVANIFTSCDPEISKFTSCIFLLFFYLFITPKPLCCDTLLNSFSYREIKLLRLKCHIWTSHFVIKNFAFIRQVTSRYLEKISRNILQSNIVRVKHWRSIVFIWDGVILSC